MSGHLRIPDRDADVDGCARCGYDLRGVDDNIPCPECGLLAERSRQGDGHLTDATPGWLLGISIGVALILVAHLLAAAWPFFMVPLRSAFRPIYALTTPGRFTVTYPEIFGVAINPELLWIGGFDLAAVTLIVGVWLLTRPQRRGARDRGLRWGLRACSLAPIPALAIAHWQLGPFFAQTRTDELLSFLQMLFLTIGLAPVPAMTFALLRRLALRVLHPRLAEHAAIVGVGLSATLVAIPLLVLAYHLGRWYGDTYWTTRSTASLVIPLAGAVFLVLFGGWSALNCVRFTIAFARAYRGARRKWRDADRSAEAL